MTMPHYSEPSTDFSFSSDWHQASPWEISGDRKERSRTIHISTCPSREASCPLQVTLVSVHLRVTMYQSLSWLVEDPCTVALCGCVGCDEMIELEWRWRCQYSRNTDLLYFGREIRSFGESGLVCSIDDRWQYMFLFILMICCHCQGGAFWKSHLWRCGFTEHL